MDYQFTDKTVVSWLTACSTRKLLQKVKVRSALFKAYCALVSKKIG